MKDATEILRVWGGVLSWSAIALGLRLLFLADKPLWTDEFATLVFSVGHSFRTVAVNQFLSLTELLEPIQTQSMGSPSDVIQFLKTESTHPPVYFILANLWMRLCSGIDLTWATRSLSVLFGVLTVPAIYALGMRVLRSPRIAHTAALLMAISPFGVYLAQEARHYTLAILWMMGSLACFAIVLQHWQGRRPVPDSIMGAWIIFNSLGFATHYFVGIPLCAQLITLLGFQLVHKLSFHLLYRLRVAIAGTVVGCSVWIPWLLQGKDSELTHWAFVGDRTFFSWINPLVNTIISVMTMHILLPIQDIPKWAAGFSVLSALIFAIWMIRWVVRSLQSLWHDWVVQGLVGVLGSTIALMLFLDYSLGMELTGAFRYAFIYFPVVILLGAIALSQTPRSRLIPILVAGILGCLTVVLNFGYQKVHRPDLVAAAIVEQSQHPAIVAIAHRTHGQTGRLMGIAQEMNSMAIARSPLFYLDHQPPCGGKLCGIPTDGFKGALSERSHAIDLWLINYQGTADLQPQWCYFDEKLGNRRVDGYRYQHYRCE